VKVISFVYKNRECNSSTYEALQVINLNQEPIP
jgi:hypothetical protein